MYCALIYINQAKEGQGVEVYNARRVVSAGSRATEASAADGTATIEAGFRAPTSRGLKMHNPASMHLGLLPRRWRSFLPLHAFFAHLETSLAPLLMPPCTRARLALPVPSTDPVADSISSAPPREDLPPSNTPSEDPDDAEDPGSDDGCYGRSLAPNITDLSFHFLLSYLISCLD